MKRTFLSAALVLALSGGVALAQQTAPTAPPDGPPPPHRMHGKPNPEREAKRLTKMLNLTPDQTAKLEPIFASRDQQMEAIHSNGQLTQEAAREQMKSIQKSTQQQLAQLKADRRHGPHGPGGPHAPGQWQGPQGQGQPQPSGL